MKNVIQGDCPCCPYADLYGGYCSYYHFFPCRIPLDLIWRVVFDQGAFCAYDERKKYVRGPLGNYDENITSKWEVKGNIHDPEWQQKLKLKTE